MIALIISVVMIVSAYQYQTNDWQYVGKHKCNQIGVVQQTKAKVYPVIVDGHQPFIILKQKNKDGSYIVSCVLPKP